MRTIICSCAPVLHTTRSPGNDCRFYGCRLVMGNRSATQLLMAGAPTGLSCAVSSTTGRSRTAPASQPADEAVPTSTCALDPPSPLSTPPRPASHTLLAAQSEPILPPIALLHTYLLGVRPSAWNQIECIGVTKSDCHLLSFKLLTSSSVMRSISSCTSLRMPAVSTSPIDIPSSVPLTIPSEAWPCCSNRTDGALCAR